MRRTTIFKILTFLYIVAVAVICFAKFSSIPTVPGKFLGLDADKVVHFLLFMPFPVLVYYSFPLQKKGLVTTLCCIVGIFILGSGLAAITEYIQSKLPYRSMDINDFKADALGMLLSSLVIFLIRLFSRRKANA